MNNPMSSKQVQPDAAISAVNAGMPFFREELPLTVREAATAGQAAMLSSDADLAGSTGRTF